MKVSKLTIVLAGMVIVALGGTSVWAAQARALMWNYSNVTSTCKDPDGDGNKISNVNAEWYGNAWLDIMEEHWSTITADNSIYASEITDANDCTWGEDHTAQNLDDGDGTLIVTHGAARPSGNPTYWRARLSSDSGNGGNDTCASRSTNMTLGDNDAEFVHAASCHSADWSLFSVGYNAMDDRLHQFGGFHGLSWTNGMGGIDDFPEDGFTSAGGLSIAWIENMTVWNVSGSDDQCAVSLVQGNNATDATNRKNYEDYDPGQYLDPSGGWTKFHFYCNCSPAGSDVSVLTCN